MKMAVGLIVTMNVILAGSAGATIAGIDELDREKADSSDAVASRLSSRVHSDAIPHPPRRVTRRLKPLALAQKFQEALDTELESHGGIGANATVITPGRKPWTGASGTTDGVAPVTPTMIFGIASMTKTYVATIVLQLAEEGTLGLDDPINLWLPAFPNVDGTATVRQLLNHTSGIFDFAEHPGYVPAIASDPTRNWSPEETIDAFVLEPYAAPGVLFHYSNTGYLLLGMIIERATGSQVSTELRSRIFDPLGLSSTFYALEEEIDGEIAHPWADLDSSGVLEDISYAPRVSGESTARASGALYSSAEDVARFLRSLIQGEILQPMSLDQMLDFLPASSSAGYGLGIQETYNFVSGRPGIGHDGGTYGYSGRMICLPDVGVFVSILLNFSSANRADDYETIHAISRALASVALDSLQKRTFTGATYPIAASHGCHGCCHGCVPLCCIVTGMHGCH